MTPQGEMGKAEVAGRQLVSEMLSQDIGLNVVQMHRIYIFRRDHMEGRVAPDTYINLWWRASAATGVVQVGDKEVRGPGSVPLPNGERL